MSAPAAARWPCSRRLPAMLAVAATLAAACGVGPGGAGDRVAENYVRLAMDLDRYRPGEVDHYFGPPSLDRRDRGGEVALDGLARRAADLTRSAAKLAESPAPGAGDRADHLAARVSELAAVIEFLRAEAEDQEAVSFEAETERLYGIAWREPDREALAAVRDAVDEALPGRGSLRIRMAELRRRLIIPARDRRAVFERALEACRRRTLEHWPLENDRGIEIVWTRDVDAAWHVYEGDGHSILKVNELALSAADRALDVACHETYPGHHAQFVLFEAAAGGGGTGPALEDTLVLLRSPASALREGAAMHAVDLVFPPEERLAFEREVLFPLAGVDPDLATVLGRVRPLLDRLELLVPAVIRDHENGGTSNDEALIALQNEALIASPRALFAYAHEVGAYLAGYTLVRESLRERLPVDDPDSWGRLRGLLERPWTWPDVTAAPLGVSTR